jgi:tungstate transport system substrate-binding protein
MHGLTGFAIATVTLALTVAACSSPAPDRRDVILATTTSFQDSGLLEVLRQDFEKRSGYRLRPTAVGTGAALAIGARGDADIVFVHAPSAEREFIAAGNGTRRMLVMHNDFVIVGPPSDPAGIKGRPTFDALRRIADVRPTFISRGDRSGTHILEIELWKRAGIAPSGSWYVEAATGMGQTLTIASEKRAYTLTDRGTFLARRSAVELEILLEKDPPLINIYHVIPVNAAKFPRVNAAGASAFAEYLVSPEAQRLIATFGVDRFGEPLFFPDAGKREEDLTGPVDGA